MYGDLIKAIDAYLAKADDNLSDALGKEGYAKPKKTVKYIKDIEDDVADALIDETDYFISEAEKAVDLETFAKDVLPQIKLSDTTKSKLTNIFTENLEKFMPEFVNYYIMQTDKELKLEQISEKTTAWVKSWSKELGEKMQLNSHKEIERILDKGLKDGVGIDVFTREIQGSGIRNEYYKARRVAVTEVLTAHRAAQQEAFTQSPAVSEKMWMHTGEHRNEPRPNHVDMNEKRVPVSEPFELTGTDGEVYKPMFPGDPVLPPSERVNCHCIAQPVVSEEILGLSLEERKRLQKEALEAMNDDWEKELDAKNKAKAGIDDDSIKEESGKRKMEWLKNKPKDEQIGYLGGKSRWALVESGVIKDGKDLERLFTTKTNSKGVEVRTRKTLTELKNDGIITIKDSTVKHSTAGDYISPSKTYPNGRLKGGGHSYAGKQELDKRGIEYNITKTFSNGVTVGNIPNHKSKAKQGISEKFPDGDIGQAWFPKNWTNDDILVAGTYVANTSKETEGIFSYGVYNGVRVGVIKNPDTNEISTIFPDNKKQPNEKGWENAK